MILQVSLDPYPATLIVIIAESDKELKTWIKRRKEYKNKEEILDRLYWQKDSCSGFYTCSPRNEGFIRLRRAPITANDIAVLTHEALHATCETLRRASLPLVSESEEAYTYLLDHIVRTVIGAYRQHK